MLAKEAIYVCVHHEGVLVNPYPAFILCW